MRFGEGGQDIGDETSEDTEPQQDEIEDDSELRQWAQQQQQQQQPSQQQQQPSSKRAQAECLFSSSRQCNIVDTLQLNPAWSRMKSSPSKLFSASNEPLSIACSTAASLHSKDYSRNGFAQSAMPKCYSPDVYECMQGKLILKVSRRNKSRGSSRVSDGATE